MPRCGAVRQGLTVALLVICLQLGLVASAAASFFDTYGVDARGMALGNAMSAVSEGWASIHYNPAALALSHDIEFSVGFYYAQPNVEVDYREGTQQDIGQFPRRSGSLDSIAGPSLGLVLPIERCTPRKLPTPIALGMGILVPRQTLSTVRVVEGAAYPFDVIFNERNTSLAFNLALSTRITPAVYLGLGMASQLDSGMEVQSFDTVDQHAAESKVRFGAPSLVAGVLIRPAERWRVGVVYRQKNQIDSHWKILVETRLVPFQSIPGLGIARQVSLAQSYMSAYTPDNVSVGGSYTVTERLQVTAEFDWYWWSDYPGPLDSDLAHSFDDVWVPRVGVIYRLTRKLEARGGFYYEPTPVTSQGSSGFFPVGNDRYVPSIGLGYTFYAPWGILAKPIAADAYFQYHFLVERDFYRANTPNPFILNPATKGYVINLGLSLTFAF